MANKISYACVRDARNAGFTESGIISLQRGYISRRADPDVLPVYMAGGNRRGSLYYLAPNPSSTRYCYRIYMERS